MQLKSGITAAQGTEAHDVPAAPGGQQLINMFYLLAGLFVLVTLLITYLNSGSDPVITFTIFTTRFLGIFIEAVPFLLLGTVVSGLIETFVSRQDLVRLMPRSPVAATLGGVFLGMVFPVCECGVVPVTRRLFAKGLPLSVGVAFLLAAPFMNPIVFASTFIAFGFGPVFIGRFVITAVVAFAVGLIFALSARPRDVLLPETLLPAGMDIEVPEQRRLGQRVYGAFNLATVEFFDMGRFLVVGCVLAAALQTLVSQDALLAVGTGPVLSVIVMQIFAFVLSVCSTVDAFLALAFTTTFTTGSILAFLSFGPMVDIKSTMMFLGVFKRRVVLYLIILPFLMNLLAGIWVNLSMGYF